MIVAHGEDSNEEEESEVVEIALNSEHIVPVGDIIFADVHDVNLPVQPIYEETFM